MRKNMKIAAGLVLALGVSSAANAAVYNVTAVQNGSQSGFAFSGFHFAGEDPASSNARDKDGRADTGSGLISITSVISGTYDTNGGIFNAVFGLSDGTNVTISSPDPGTGLNFDGSSGELLAAGSTLDIDFSAPDTASLFDTTIAFAPGYVCCGSTNNDPNTFNPLGNGIMTLWGADDSRGSISSDSSSYSKIGLDLRIELTTVPVPAAVWLFGTGLLGLVGVARRRV